MCFLGPTQLEKCAQDLGSTSKTVGSSMAQLLTCAAQGNEHYTGKRRMFYIEQPTTTTNHLSDLYSCSKGDIINMYRLPGVIFYW